MSISLEKLGRAQLSMCSTFYNKSCWTITKKKMAMAWKIVSNNLGSTCRVTFEINDRPSTFLLNLRFYAIISLVANLINHWFE